MKKVLPSNAILLPDNAERVFDGQIFDVYQWPQQLFDGSMATFEMLKRPDTVQVIAIQGDNLLLINNVQPGRGDKLSFPGGRVDEEDESWLKAAQRELLEETGLSFAEWRLIWVQQPAPKIEWFTPFYLATQLISESEASPDAGEKITLKWMSFDEVKTIIDSGEDPMLAYAMPLFRMFDSLGELLALPQFSGKEVDR